MRKRIAAGIFAVLMLFMVAAPGSAVRADGGDNVTPGDAAKISNDGGSDEETYIDDAEFPVWVRAFMGSKMDLNHDGRVSVAEAEKVSSLEWRDDENSPPNMKALVYFKNLTKLYMDAACVSDISVLKGMTNMEYLDLECNGISDISALEDMTNLTYLDLRDNSISDISALEGMTNLTSLYLGGNSISDISALEGMTNLTSLDLGLCAGGIVNYNNNNISDISALESLPNLKHLELSCNSISDISVLADLQNLTSLTSLGLWGNSISDISALEGMTNLTSLYLYGNEITESEARAKLPQQFLDDTEWFEAQKFLKGEDILELPSSLYDAAIFSNVDTNKDENISVAEAEACTELTITKWDEEQEDLLKIGYFRNLKNLKMQGGFQRLPKIGMLENLEQLDASNNQLTVLPDLKSCTNLSIEGTDFRNNQITESEARAKLPQQLLDDTEWFERQGFLKDEVPEPEPEPEPQPGDKYEIDLGDGDTGIGSDAFEELLKKNKHCTVEINLDNGVRFSFEMGSMHVVEGKDVYDFGCTLIRNYEKLPPAMQSVIRNNSFVTRILYNYSGKLPGTVSIRIYVGQQYAGQTLYYYRENKDNTFTFMQEALVDADGYITVQQDHCSDYVLLGEKREDNTPGGTETDTPSGAKPDSPSGLTPDIPVNGTPGTSSDSAPGTATDVLSGTANPLPVTQAAPALAGSTTAPKTGDDNAVAVHRMLLLAACSLSVCGTVVYRRKRFGRNS